LSDTGWWYYFPLAMVFKTPLTTLFAIVVTLFIGLFTIGRWMTNPKSRWLAICLLLPVVIYGASAMNSNLNLGIRHILPVYPFIYIAIGLAIAHLWPKAHTLRTIIVVLAALLAFETLAAFPNFISYFNVAAGGSRGGLRLLSDSNL